MAILLRNLLESTAGHGTGEVRVTRRPMAVARHPRRHRRPAAEAFAHRAGQRPGDRQAQAPPACARALDIGLSRRIKGGRGIRPFIPLRAETVPRVDLRGQSAYLSPMRLLAPNLRVRFSTGALLFHPLPRAGAACG